MNSDRCRFGPFEFSATNRELRREGVPVRLQSQPAQVLACLVQHAGEVVTRLELRRSVWSEGTFVDFDHGLNFCIAQIRSALDDDAVTPRFIRTIPKRGYQFIAAVEKITETASPPPHLAKERRRFSRASITAFLVTAIVLLGIAFAVGYRLRPHQALKRLPVLAVLRFDNETASPDTTIFSDGLTDSVVERLTALSRGRYQVIGNARILRRPREERDLRAIASTLSAEYVVLGQVERNGVETRILAHLIRLPDQTHIWVVRMDLPPNDPLEVESEVAQKIAAEFSVRIEKDATGSALPQALNQ